MSDKFNWLQNATQFSISEFEKIERRKFRRYFANDFWIVKIYNKLVGHDLKLYANPSSSTKRSVVEEVSFKTKEEALTHYYLFKENNKSIIKLLMNDGLYAVLQAINDNPENTLEQIWIKKNRRIGYSGLYSKSSKLAELELVEKFKPMPGKQPTQFTITKLGMAVLRNKD